jgi:hypothetical protein
MAKTLQDLVNGTPQGGTLDLKGATYTVGGVAGENPTYPWFIPDTKSLTIVGGGAHIVVQPGTLNRRGLLVRGSNVKLLGDVTVHGDGPDVARYSYSHEFGHCVELQGAVNFESTWKVENGWGNGYYVGKRTFSDKTPERWSQGVVLHDFTSAHMGRQHLALQAVHGVSVSKATMTDAARSAVDIEPPGSNWGCDHLLWTDTDLTGGFEYALANLGNGNQGGVHDITLDGIRCHGQYFGVMVDPPASTRRQNYTFKNCTSDTKANHTPIRVYNVDGLTVHNITQPLGTPALVQAVGCTGVVTDAGVVVTTS